MPISSYLLFCNAEKVASIQAELSQIPACTTLPSLSHSVIVVATDTQSEKEEKDLAEQLSNMTGVECLSQVFGHREDEIEALDSIDMMEMTEALSKPNPLSLQEAV